MKQSPQSKERCAFLRFVERRQVLLAEKPLHEPCPETVCSCFGAFQ